MTFYSLNVFYTSPDPPPSPPPPEKIVILFFIWMHMLWETGYSVRNEFEAEYHPDIMYTYYYW